MGESGCVPSASPHPHSIGAAPCRLEVPQGRQSSSSPSSPGRQHQSSGAGTEAPGGRSLSPEVLPGGGAPLSDEARPGSGGSEDRRAQRRMKLRPEGAERCVGNPSQILARLFP